MADFNVKELKAKYVVGSIPADGIDCSVGGALCLEMLSRQRDLTETLIAYTSFPSAVLLADFLSIANSRCGELLLLDYANDIFQLNSEDELEDAWDKLDQALNEDN